LTEQAALDRKTKGENGKTQPKEKETGKGIYLGGELRGGCRRRWHMTTSDNKMKGRRGGEGGESGLHQEEGKPIARKEDSSLSSGDGGFFRLARRE